MWRTNRYLRLEFKQAKLLKNGDDKSVLKALDYIINEDFSTLFANIKSNRFKMEVFLYQGNTLVSKSTNDVTSSFVLTKEKTALLNLLYGNVESKAKEAPSTATNYRIEFVETPNFYKSVRSTIFSEKIPDEVSIYIRVENCNLPPVVVPFTRKNHSTIEFVLPSLRDLTGAPFRPLTDTQVNVVISDTRLRTNSPIRVTFHGLLFELVKVAAAPQLLRFQAITAASSLKFMLNSEYG